MKAKYKKLTPNKKRRLNKYTRVRIVQQCGPYGRTKKPDATVNINDVQNVYCCININKTAEATSVYGKCVCLRAVLMYGRRSSMMPTTMNLPSLWTFGL